MFSCEFSTCNYNSFLSSEFECSDGQVINLNEITSQPNKFICTVDGTEVKISQFYIYRRKGFLTTIVVQLADDIWGWVSLQLGKELIINWQSENFNGVMANSLIQDVSFKMDAKGRVIKLHAFRAKKEFEERYFTLDNVQETITENGALKSIICSPQPTISPEDIVRYKDIEYTVNTVKIIGDTFKTRMVVAFG